MSAVVGILNTQAVAIAADSAVSINGKIYNRALKIFTLSKYHPIGIMIYSSATFMGTPWETIIKMYRGNLKEKSFGTVKEYVDDFINYLKNQGFSTDESIQKYNLNSSLLYPLFINIYESSISQVSDDVTIHDAMNAYLDSLVANWRVDAGLCNEFADFGLDQFNDFVGEVFNEQVTEFYNYRGVGVTEEIKEKIKTIAIGIIRNQENFTYFTGLVFTGFGDNQIFPNLTSLNIHFAVQKRLKYYETEHLAITHEMTSAIRPFAQTDAMNTILRGIAPNLENIYVDNMRQYLQKYNERLVNLTKVDSPELAAAIEGIDIDAQVNSFVDKMSEAKRVNYIGPLMDAVGSLSKEDLAEMAESLIYLTYLQKKITFAAEDVGGAVDVAVISKGDGFIWIKRKHYFKPELNKFFFDNYFK